MSDVYILAIETSCDETSCAIVKNGKEVISSVISTQIKTHNQTGGVIPEIASRLHVEQMTYIIDQTIIKSNISIDRIDAIAVTSGPGLVGSLLVGIEAAKAMAFCYNKPLIGVHHIAGHIYANNVEFDMKFPLLSLVVSGGHTDLILMENHLNFKKLCSTADDAIGETFDKVARLLQLPYPGGPHVDRLAKTGQLLNLRYSYDKNGDYFSFSGLKTAVINHVNTLKMKDEEISEEDICATFQTLAISQLIDKTLSYIEKYDVKQLLVAGGVAANSYLRNQLKENIDIEIAIPSIKYCTDNAVMIGCVAYYQFLNNDFATYELNANPNLKLNEVNYV